MNLDQKSSLKACLEEEKENPRMKNYVNNIERPWDHNEFIDPLEDEDEDFN